jgi:hypothetical protein
MTRIVPRVFGVLSVVLFLSVPAAAFAGSQTFSTPGQHSFTVPSYTGKLTVEVWGGGGGASGGPYFHNISTGGTGGTSAFDATMTQGSCNPNTAGGLFDGRQGCAGPTLTGGIQATGGKGGTASSRQGWWWLIYVAADGGAGGSGSGGQINMTGQKGGQGPGGAAAGGGGGPDQSPGGGGSGTNSEIGGGGGGGYARTIYQPGQLTKGESMPIVVGTGGTGADFGGYRGNDGAPGMVKITWEDTAAPPPAPNPVCDMKIDPNVTVSGTSGSRTFATPGSYSFTVPKYDGSMTIEVWGGGGGASGGPYFHNISTGQAGTQSSAYSMTAGGGKGGTASSRQGPWWIIYVPASGGAGGTASGGATNLTGGAGTAGYGGASPHGGGAGSAPGGGGGTDGNSEVGGGGAGGYAKTTYTAANLPEGTDINITVGTGGPGASFGGYTGGSGASGAVRFTWTASGKTSTVCSEGFHLDNGRCITDACPICPAGETLNELGVCVPASCPIGQHWDATQRKCIIDTPPVCPVDQHWDATQNRCVPNDCPAGQHWDVTQNKCVPNECPAGQIWNGTACVCPAGTIWYQNKCQANLCTPRAECDANGNVRRTNIECEVTTDLCRWGCTNGACNPPPQPQVITWKVAPKLVQKQATTGVFWNVMNVESCTVSSTNSDSWTEGTGGVSQGSKTSRPITARTTFTLVCTPYDGATWTPQAPQVVNVVPVFEEK